MTSRSAYPSKLFVELTTRCNLRCGMCVKQAGGISEGSMSDETFEALAPAFPHIKALILNGIGESLLHPHLEKYIGSAKKLLPENAWVGFQTNGMLLDNGRAASLVGAGLDRLCLSMDSVSCEGFSSIRNGGEMSRLEGAFSSLSRYRSRLRIGIEFVLMRSNLRELPAAIRYAARRGASFALVTQLLPYGKEQVSLAAYDTNTAGAVAVLERWLERAAKEGADIRRYNEIFMKFRKNPQEQKIVDLVGKMKQDACSRGIALHLERLLTRDDDWFRRVEEVFEEARQAAEEEGMEIRLPATAPHNNRTCEFAEAGSAFISWNGDVHPCYFLWHRYRCFTGGWEKQVKPWVFGNLHDNAITDIWDSAGCRSFRKAVLRYQFPFCFDCGFALCDYVQGEDFEQDCHIGDVPCGACLWCTGLFQCLQ